MKILTTTIFFLLINLCYATEQLAERLILNGKNYAMCDYDAFPMEEYKKNNKIKNPFEWTSTDNYRGYVGKYIIKDNKLFCIGGHYLDYVNKKEIVVEFQASKFTQNEDDKEIFCDWFSSDDPIRLSLKSNIWQAGFLDEENYTLEVKKGIAKITKDIIHQKNMSVEDFRRLKDYNPKNDNIDSWYDLSLVNTICTKKNKLKDGTFEYHINSHSYSINKEDFEEIKKAKTIKTRGILLYIDKNKEGKTYITLKLPYTRKNYPQYFNIDTDKDLRKFKNKFVEIETTNPFKPTINLLSIRVLSPQESIHNPKLEDRKFITPQEYYDYAKDKFKVIIIEK